jgi:peptide/nickel transport system ATP-binding protein
MSTVKETILEVRNLSVDFITKASSLRAVNGVSFSLPKGKTIGIVGESGSGKSVTSLALMRLIQNPPGKIESGEVLFYSNSEVFDLLKLTEKEMCRYRGNEIAMIFQEPMTSLNPVYTCGRQVSEAIRLHQKKNKRQAKELTLNWFSEVLLPRPEIIYKSYPHQLSGGQKQRVMIAMAMCCNPSILIADEPTTALDVTIQKTILDLMKSLQKKYGMSIIFITHDLGVVAELADHILVMHKGKVVEQGNVRDIFKNPQHPYTRGLLACRPDPESRLKKLPTVGDFMTAAEKGKDAAIPDLLTPDFYESSEERFIRHAAIYNHEPILRIENLKMWYPEKRSWTGKIRSYTRAIDNASFEVYPGETLGLVGESGCGKTTLGRSILRLIEPQDGKIFFDGNDISKMRPLELRKQRKQMQIIFQDPYSSLSPRMMIGEALMEPLRAHKICKNEQERKQKVIELLQRVNMEDNHFYRYPHEFSGGQRQRICIARALVLNPKFIICDESVSALDVSVQAQVLNLLNELKRDFGFTYIFISHDLAVVKFMSDRIIVMQNGKIVEVGEADDIYNHPVNPYTRSLIAAIPRGL